MQYKREMISFPELFTIQHNSYLHWRKTKINEKNKTEKGLALST